SSSTHHQFRLAQLHPLSCHLSFFFYLSIFTAFTLLFFFFNAPATTEIYTLSLHDALPIYYALPDVGIRLPAFEAGVIGLSMNFRSEEHTSELQSLAYLVCRLLLEKKKIQFTIPSTYDQRDYTYYVSSLTKSS